MRKVIFLLACLIALGTGPAMAQSREPAQRQILVELAYVLGEAHALRQVCAGQNDQFWRARMMKMLEAESADKLFEQRLRETFNAGYVSRQSQYTRCTDDIHEAESQVAARGQRLARRLTGR